jgi:short-subunit dehydrogenase
MSSKNRSNEQIVEPTLLDIIKDFWKPTLTVCIALLIAIPEFFIWIKKTIFPQPKNVSGQLVLITGGSIGIGKAVALRLAREGCNIAIANRNHEEGQKTAIEITEKYNVRAEAFKVDVSNHDDVAKLKKDIESSMGTVDILINNAGLLSLEHSLLEGEPKDIQKVIDVNLTAYFWVIYFHFTRKILLNLNEF